jgi:endonuclease-3
VYRALARAYGVPPAQQKSDPLDGLIGTILSQNTTSTNARAAFGQLKRRCPTWEACLAARTSTIRAAIRSAGLADRRAPRIRQILQRLHDERGEVSLDFIYDWPVERGREYLESLPGVGPKTASCVLLFSCRKRVFPVDTHVARITRRLRWVAPNAAPEEIQGLLEPLIPANLRYGLHVNLIAHGRTVCRPQQPKCEACPILRYCPTGGQGRSERSREA